MTTIIIKRDTPKDIPKGFFLSATIEVDSVDDLTIIERGLMELLAKYQDYSFISSAVTVGNAGWENKIARIEAMLEQLKE